jgi:hypothetical protein
MVIDINFMNANTKNAGIHKKDKISIRESDILEGQYGFFIVK